MICFGREFLRWTEKASEGDEQCLQHALGWSFSQMLCKDYHFWGEFTFFIQ